jgi:hypothetical protein
MCGVVHITPIRISQLNGRRVTRTVAFCFVSSAVFTYISTAFSKPEFRRNVRIIVQALYVFSPLMSSVYIMYYQLSLKKH